MEERAEKAESALNQLRAEIYASLPARGKWSEGTSEDDPIALVRSLREWLEDRVEDLQDARDVGNYDMAIKLEALEAENERLKKYEEITRDTICWDVECEHEAKALNQMAAQQQKMDEYRNEAKRCREIARILCEKLEVHAALSGIWKNADGSIGMFICAPTLNEANLGPACKAICDGVLRDDKSVIKSVKVAGTEGDEICCNGCEEGCRWCDPETEG